MFFELDAAGDVMRRFDELLVDAPEELGAFFAFQIAPPLPFIPEDRHGATLCLIVSCWSGDLAEGEKVVGALLTWAPSSPRTSVPSPYPARTRPSTGCCPGAPALLEG